MRKAVIELDSSQLLGALEQLSQDDVKKIMDTLFLKKLFKKPDFTEVSAKAKKVIEKQKLSSAVVEEAVEWARKQK